MANEDPVEALRQVFARADETLAGWSCPGSTDCCHFGRTGREPHLWPIEWKLVERAIKARGVKKTALRVHDEQAEGRCALLENGRCTIYADRPFGCRTFYCSRAEGPGKPRAELARLGKEVAALSERSLPSEGGPRSLGSWLKTRC
jgi:Fe-S-cluster containining protein